MIFKIFCLELGGGCTRGPLDFDHPAHPIATPLTATDVKTLEKNFLNAEKKTFKNVTKNVHGLSV